MSQTPSPRVLCHIRGIGHHLPEGLITNHDLEQMVETSDEWITQRTGIKSRHKLADDQTTSDLALAAAQHALENAGMKPEDLDMILVATATPDMIIPATACRLQTKLGITGIPSMDVSAACSGFGYTVTLAAGQISSGLYDNILVVGAESMTRFLDYTKREVCVLFGDGAGAVVLGKQPGQYELLFTSNGADGSCADNITIPGGGAMEPGSEKTVADRRHFVHMTGREVFRNAVRQMASSAREAMAALDLEPDQVRWFVPHQANARIIQAVGETLELDPAKVVIDLTDKGNTTAASIPLAFSGLHHRGEIDSGDYVLTVGYGAGATWSCQVYRKL